MGVLCDGYGTCTRKKSQRTECLTVAFPFLLKIDSNTLCIIQKFRSLVAATRKPGPVALISRLPPKGLGAREQWLGLGERPQRLLALESARWG